MIQNKSIRINLSLVLALCFMSLVACSGSPKKQESAGPVVDSPPPEEVVRNEPIENSDPIPAAPEPDVPDASPINEGIPDRYVVRKGDTLWDISSHFLKDPWLWPEVWHVNPKIRNPHLIYPGDVIALTWQDGKPRITIEGAEGEPPPPPPSTNLNTVKLSPTAREQQLKRAIDTIPKSAISVFLTRPFILDDAAVENAPYIVSNYGNNVISGKGKKIYVRPILDSSVITFNVVRKGREYIDPDSKEFLGYEAINLVETEEVDLNFFPRAPERDVAGRIISVANALQKVGQYDIVVINKGTDDGLEPGHVLEIHQQGDLVKSPRGRHKIRLPEERAGLLMIFKPNKTISYALVMEAFNELAVYDYVYSP